MLLVKVFSVLEQESVINVASTSSTLSINAYIQITASIVVVIFLEMETYSCNNVLAKHRGEVGASFCLQTKPLLSAI